MNILKSNVFTIVLFTVIFLLQNAYCIKTQDQILNEIKSMADGIETECTDEAVKAKCDNAKRQVDNSLTLSSICKAMDTYIVCQDNNCVNKSTAMTQILTDAMIIPYCGELKDFPSGTKAASIANQVSEMSRLCNFTIGLNCDTEQTAFLRSKSIGDLCLGKRNVALCLDKKCSSQSPALKQKITEAKNDTTCYFQMLAQDMSMKCDNELFSGTCDKAKTAVDNGESFNTLCPDIQTYTVCLSLNCFKKSRDLKTLLNNTEVIKPYCGGLTMQLDPAVNTVLTEMNGMMDECHFMPGKNCVKIQGSFYVTSVSVSEVCLARRSYGECLQILCQSPSSKLRDKMENARKGLSCDARVLQTCGFVVVLVAVGNYLWSILRI